MAQRNVINVSDLAQLESRSFAKFQRVYNSSLNEKTKQILMYWLNTWSDYLQNEHSFSPDSLIEYSYGDIISLNLGFNVGSEQGGLHYAVVIDKQNIKSSPVLTVIPLKSLGDGETIDERIEMLIDSDIFSGERRRCSIELESINKKLETSSSIALERRKRTLLKDLENFENQTVVQITQVRTISKMRIYCPKHNADRLSGVKMPVDIMKSRV